MFSCDGADVGVNGGYIFCKNTLVKTDEIGAVEWAYLYNTNAHFHQVKKTFDNCYIATGELLVLGGIKEIMTIKVNEQGEVIWYNLYGGNNNDDERSYSICETSDSNYIIAGYTATYGYGSSDIYLLRIDRFGNLRWARTVGEEGSEAPGEVKQLRDGNFLVVGNSNVPGKDFQIYLVKFNKGGDTLWTRTYGGNGYENGQNFIQTSDGGFAVIATTTSYAPGGQADIMLVKTDSNGYFEWSKTYGGAFVEVGKEVIELADHGFLLVGYTQSFGSGGDCGALGTCYDRYLIRTDSVGDTLWTKTYGRYGIHDWAEGAFVTNDKGYLLYGQSFGNDYNRNYVTKTDSNGYVPCFIYGTQTIVGSPVLQVTSGWGRTSHGGQTGITNLDNWEISVAIDSMLCQPVSVQENFTMNFAIFPNPANDHVTVCYPDIFRMDLKEITFYNNLGSSVKQIISTENITEALVYIGDLPAGIYFAVLRVEGRKVGTEKVVVR